MKKGVITATLLAMIVGWLIIIGIIVFAFLFLQPEDKTLELQPVQANAHLLTEAASFLRSTTTFNQKQYSIAELIVLAKEPTDAREVMGEQLRAFAGKRIAGFEVKYPDGTTFSEWASQPGATYATHTEILSQGFGPERGEGGLVSFPLPDPADEQPIMITYYAYIPRT